MKLKIKSSAVIYTALFTFSLAFITSCTTRNKEELQKRGSGCDTTRISYSNNVVRILSDNGCLGCHGETPAGNNIQLNTYDAVKVRVDDGKLLGSIEHRPPYEPMPQFQPKLEPCTISKIRVWINNGAPNN